MQGGDRDASARRVAALASQVRLSPHPVILQRSNVAASETNGHRKEVKPEAPPNLELRQDGWGYEDTEFDLTSDGQIGLKGNRYPFSGMVFPNFRPWVEKVVGINVDDLAQTKPASRPAAPILNTAFVEAAKGSYNRMSTSDRDRVFHGHGHTCQEVYAVRFGQLERVPDVVIWPGSHEHVERLVQLANEHDVCIIPFGGGTSVSGALLCPVDEKRMIVSLDMHEMNNIKWIDAENGLVCMEAGIVGQDMKRRLEAEGFTIGHEPDSLEFSSLGGWIATRASGMKKSAYGNIEDMLVRVRMVTSVGTVDRKVEVPRVSMGPDVQHVVLGSEGTLGVVTEAVLRLRPLPAANKYGSLVFPDLESGVKFMHEVARQRVAPASIRLVDNDQFQFGLALKPKQTNPFAPIFDGFKKAYVTQWQGFNPTQMCVATLNLEGTPADIARQHKIIRTIAAHFRGLDAGAENGYRGYFLTFMIAYLRDFGMKFHYIAESFETSVPWGNVLMLCEGVKRRVRSACKAAGVPAEPFVSCRVTQAYDSGACVYFYFGFSWKGLTDPVAIFSAVEKAAREEILALGGSLSHHHGVGKHRQQWLQAQVSQPGLAILSGIKKAVDPKNVFGNGNLVGDGSGVPTHHH